MGSLLKTSVVAAVGFLLLLPALVCGDRYVQLSLFQDGNCTEGPSYQRSYQDFSETPTATFDASSFNESYTFESAILINVTGDVLSLVACQAGLLCSGTRALNIQFNLGDIGACSAGPAGTKFDKFLLS